MLVVLSATAIWLSFRTAPTPLGSVLAAADGGTKRAPPRTSRAMQTAAGIGWAQRSNGQLFDGRKTAIYGATFAVSLNHPKQSLGDASPFPSITVTNLIV